MTNIFRIIIIISFLVSARNIFAADVILEQALPQTSDIKVGDEVLIVVSMVSEGVEHNAIEGVLIVPPIFEIDRVITGNSFVTVWLEDPAEFNDGQIRFSGITPAGYNRENGVVFSVVLKALSSGTANISMNDVGVFKNDGQGTREGLVVRHLPLRLRASKSEEEPYLILVKDVTQPQAFEVELVRNPDLYDGKYTLVWSARDVGGGISSYDVHEGKRVFKHVLSPYVLENQHLNGKIKVVAHDLEGNTRISEVVTPGKYCVDGLCFGYEALALIALVVALVLFYIWKKLRK